MPGFPAEIEGTIESIVPTGTGATIVAVGVSIRVVVDAMVTVVQEDGSTEVETVTTTIATPAGPLSLADLLRTDPATDRLPGRDPGGFLEGTVIAEGTFDPDPAAPEAVRNVLTATAITVEPGETVLAGPLTGNDAGALSINGVPLQLIGDVRLKAKPPRTEDGFAVRPESIPLNAPMSAEGYFAGGEFHAYLVEVDAEGLMRQLRFVNPAPEVSIARAQTRLLTAEYDLDARGAVRTDGPGPALLELRRVDAGTRTRIATFRTDRPADGVARWRYDASVPLLAPPLNVPPTTVEIALLPSGPGRPTASLDVEAR